jgi:two-component system, response regulator PdtaR
LPAQSPARILTVEDDPIVRADLRLVLEDAGFDVLPDARDGVEAVDRAREHRPDLILIDLGLPRQSGVEATRQILGERDVPIVALTGYRDGELVDEALDAGAVGHVLKPFHDRQLVETLRIALTEGSRKQGDENERRRQLLLIDSLVRRGYAEAQIIAALEDRDAIG